MNTPHYQAGPCELEELRAWLAARAEPLNPLTLREIEISENALDGLYDRAGCAVRDRPAAYLIMDRTPMVREGVAIKPQLVETLHRRIPGLSVIELGEPDAPPHAELRSAEALAEQLDPGSWVVTFGSGTITDLAKHAMYLLEQEGRPVFEHVCCPTACTVTAFTSAMAVLAVDGVKRTMRSRAPDVVIVDLALIRDAPVALTQAGFGDLMARCTAYGDWYLGDVLGVDETFNTVPFDLLARVEQDLLDQADRIGRLELDGIRSLAEALMLAGIGMSIVAQTTPISGWEHVMSHYLDLRAMAAGRETGLHGEQVGAATLVSARAFEALLDAGASIWTRRPQYRIEEARQRIATHFGPYDASGAMVEELWRDYRRKAERIVEACKRWQGIAEHWQGGEAPERVRSYVRPARVIEEALRRARATADLVQATGTADQDLARSSVLHGHRVRRRFTLGDVLELLGLLTPGAIDRWLGLG